MIMCMLSGISETKSQKLSCADCAWGKPRSGAGFHGVHEIRKLDRILDEEHRNVVADEIPIAALRVELHGEAANVAREIERAFAADDRREPHERRRHLSRPLKQVCARYIRQRVVRFEEAMRAEAARVHDSLGYSLVIEMEKLFAKVKIFE